jgi:general secretion pathway protein A
VYRFTGGIPRLINLLCDRALLAGFSARTNRILPEIVDKAAHTLDLEPPSLVPDWLKRRAAALAIGIAAGIGAAGLIYGAALLQTSGDLHIPIVDVSLRR